ncbi:zinc transporter ZIP3 [Folsomia candida]|uniref:zinc transporter ZIP3 n=1 Tax=Folsomia candida TaxID=158441 RepID=UPI000B8FB4A3|nr:zinc transporter ZIP3 [Folsomia candida]XP_021961885.1 zinc transporter ZIP3 [Folsomia candida]
MAITCEKWVVMGLLAVISTLFGFLPYILFRSLKTCNPIYIQTNTYKMMVSILACFGAGVLLSLALIHLLPHVREMFEEISTIWEIFPKHFPIAEATTLAGFGLIYFVEEIAHILMVDTQFGHSHTHAQNLPKIDTCSAKIISNNNVNLDSQNLAIGVDANSKNAIMSEDHNPNEDIGSDLTSSLKAFMALLALSFHEFMEGMAIGIQNESSMWVMFGGVASHKFVIAFCLGMEFVNSRASRKTMIGSVLFFGCITSIGIGVGGLIQAEGSSDSIYTAVIGGLATGTLLYVVFFEILNREREKKMYELEEVGGAGILQFAAVVVGMIFMEILSIMVSHHHHHGHGEDHNA